MGLHGGMKIAIVGGHGQIARRLTRLLHDRRHQTVSLIRNPAHADRMRASGAEPRVIDLESTTVEALAAMFQGCGAVVFAAGAGPGSGAARKLTMDRDGATLTADACQMADVRRLIVVSAMNAERADPDSDDVFQVYLRAKAEADADIRSRRQLDYTIVRPGPLTNDPGTGLVEAGDGLDRVPISRDDVAQALHVLIDERLALRTQFDLVTGLTPIAEALRRV